MKVPSTDIHLKKYKSARSTQPNQESNSFSQLTYVRYIDHSFAQGSQQEQATELGKKWDKGAAIFDFPIHLLDFVWAIEYISCRLNMPVIQRLLGIVGGYQSLFMCQNYACLVINRYYVNIVKVINQT